jgi:pimeloyl-ACP methyl ester carboxylesterase
VSQFPPETKYVDVDGGQVGYQVVGEGPLDLVWPGGMGNNIDLVWDLAPVAAFLRSLTSIGRCIFFDHRGRGISDPIRRDTPPTWEDWAEDLRRVLDAAGSRRAAVLAGPDTGPIAMLFAAMHPERLSRLVLINTGASYARDDDYPFGASPEDIDAFVAFIEQTWGTPVARAFMPSSADDEEFLRLQARMERASASPRSAAAEWEYIARHVDVRQALPLIQAPTLVIHNRDLQFVPVEHGRYLADHIPGAKLVELPGGDVFRYGTQLFDEVAEFLTGERPTAPINRILTTVLFTDIVESTARVAALGDQHWHSTLDAHDRAVREQLRRFRGNEINTTGDGFVASFDGPARAIRCAVAISEATRHLGIEVRSGIHTGECEVRGDDLGGLTVHIANRIAALAGPGEILVSHTIVDLTAGSGLQFQPRGENQLKGVPGTWPTFAAVPGS